MEYKLFAIQQARKPLILRDFLKSSVSPFVPNNDNPNYIIQMGNVFGFIISGENVLRVGIKASTLPFSLFYAIFHSQYFISKGNCYGL